MCELCWVVAYAVLGCCCQALLLPAAAGCAGQMLLLFLLLLFGCSLGPRTMLQLCSSDACKCSWVGSLIADIQSCQARQASLLQGHLRPFLLVEDA